MIHPLVLEIEPVWVTAKADQRMAELAADAANNDQIQALMVLHPEAPIIAHLVEEPDVESKLDVFTRDRTCDNCKEFDPERTMPTGVVRKMDSRALLLSLVACYSCLSDARFKLVDLP